MNGLLRSPVLGICILAFSPGVIAQCFTIGISCQITHVSTASVSEAQVMSVFATFAKAENFNCSPVPSVPRITLSCQRKDGINIDGRRDNSRLSFVSRAPFGLKGPDTLRVFNARMAGLLKTHFSDAVETVTGTPSASTPDIFSGIYLSESRENYGTAPPGAIRIEVTREGFVYRLNYSREGKALFAAEAEECDPRKYPIRGNDWGPDANVSGLCTVSGGMQILYTEKGLAVPDRREVFRSRYYSNVQFSFYAFRKIK